MADVLQSILDLCVSIDVNASTIYERLARNSEDPGCRSLWLQMSEEESRHVGYWKKLGELAVEGNLPQVFDRPHRVRDELRQTLVRVEAILDDCEKATGPSDAFLAAFRLEFYLLHPAFETFMYFLGQLLPGEDPEDDYDSHLGLLIRKMQEIGSDTPELELLGDTIGRLWSQNRQLQIQNHQDSLTGVLNRRGIVKAAGPLAHLAHRNGSLVGAVMFDVDDFKGINDRKGHAEGDGVLASVGKALQDRARRSDLVGRYGGDEFLVVLSNILPGTLEMITEDLRTAAATACGGTGVRLSAGATARRIGRSVDQELTSLIEEADAALYKAKKAGRDRSVIRAD